MKKAMLCLLGSTLLTGALMLQMPAHSHSSISYKAPEAATPVDNADLDFVLVNKTGYDIDAIYMSPSQKDSWGDNILSEVCMDGSTVNIMFHAQASVAHWDMKIEWSDGDTPVFWKNLDLTTINKLTIYYDEDNEKTTAKAE